MTLTAKERRKLLAESHTLKPLVVASASKLTSDVVEHVRAALAGQRLMKVRLHADSGAECDAAAVTLARDVPCEIVKRVGRIVVLYRREPESDAEHRQTPD